MILLTLGQTAENIVVTLNEKRTIVEDGYYLFVFTHIETRTVVNVLFAFIDDASGYQDRYNQFDINTTTAFNGKPTGTWRYEVYEQLSSSNTNIAGLNQVEKGLMQLDPATAFAFESYDPTTSYKAYAG